MIISNYLKMTHAELEEEILKQRKKIDTAKETIKLLRKLQIASVAESEKKKQQNPQSTQSQMATHEPERKAFNGIPR